MARHAPGHRVDRVADVHAFLVELVRQLAHGVLRLCDREAVARHDDDALRVREQDADVIRRRRLDRAARGGERLLRHLELPKAPKRTLRTDRPIALAIISVSSVPAAPTSIPLTISTV